MNPAFGQKGKRSKSDICDFLRFSGAGAQLASPSSYPFHDK